MFNYGKYSKERSIPIKAWKLFGQKENKLFIHIGKRVGTMVSIEKKVRVKEEKKI